MKRNLKTRVLLFMRRNGFLCKVTKPKPSKQLRISHTVYPDKQLSPIDTEVYVYLQNKKSSYKNCEFDVLSRKCICGVTLDNFGAFGCPNKTTK